MPEVTGTSRILTRVFTDCWRGHGVDNLSPDPGLLRGRPGRGPADDQAAEIGGGDAGVDIEVFGWRLYVECLSIRSAVQSVLGRPREGLEFAERFPALLRRSGPRVDLAQPATDRIWTCWVLGDADRG